MRNLWLAIIMVLVPCVAQAGIGPQSSSDEICAARPANSPALMFDFTRERTGEARTTGSLVLASDFNVVTIGDSTRVDDFALCRIVVWNAGAKAIENQSCYAAPAFRIMELYNREYLAGMLAQVAPESATGQSVAVLAPFWAEQELSVQKTASDPLTARTVGDVTEWRLGDEVVARTSVRGFAFSLSEKQSIARYFSRSANLHPQIRRAILASGQLPERIETLELTGKAPVTVVLTLSNPQRLQADYPIPTGRVSALRTRSEGGGDQAVALRSVLTVTDGKGPAKPSLDSLVTDISAAAPEQPVTAVMTFFATAQIHYGALQGDSDGAKTIRAISPILRKAFAAPEAAAFLNASELAGKKGEGPEREAAARYLSQAQYLDKVPYGAFRYVTFANLVNTTRDAGTWDKSIAAAMPSLTDGYWRFIEVAPWAANTYYDLGNALYVGYDMEAAWEVWDLGRAADPEWETSLIKNVPGLEARLRADFPDSF